MRQPCGNRLPALMAIAVASCFASTAPRALAHHGPEHVIEELSARIAAEGATPELLVRRGDERRQLGAWRAAEADYQHALSLHGKSLPALLGLARVRLALQENHQAIATAQRGIEVAGTAETAAVFHALVARAHAAEHHPTAALSAWRRAAQSESAEVDWLLAHAECLARVEGPRAARDALAGATQRNPSVVLRRAWIGSLIECGDFALADELIAAGLKRSRWKRSWLLLSARLEWARGERRAALRDAKAALREAESRLADGPENKVLAAQRDEALQLVVAINNGSS